ncbi:GOLPH3/VPS74 family protein [Streptomyces sp. NBC_00370]|uniref:GOLPH3/VPS74 family protein n=1 Tax=Streptomyces sp. NBC_00370 TaxID=2975728 RepID=UPI002E26D05A
MDQPVVTLPEELLLLALNPETGRPRTQMAYVRLGVAGAVLAELAAAGRVAEQGGKVVVRDKHPTGDPELDDVLVKLVAKGGEVRLRGWIRGTSRQVTDRYLRRLVKLGAVREEKHRALGIFPFHRYPPGGTDWSTPAVARLGAAGKMSFPEERSRALAGLVSAVDLARPLFPGSGARQLRGAMRELARDQWHAHAVRRVVQSEKSASANGGG